MIALKALAFAAFNYAAWGWLIVPPSILLGAL